MATNSHGITEHLFVLFLFGPKLRSQGRALSTCVWVGWPPVGQSPQLSKPGPPVSRAAPPRPNQGGVGSVWRWDSSLNQQAEVRMTILSRTNTTLPLFWDPDLHATSSSISLLNVSQAFQIQHLFLTLSPNLILHSPWLCHISSCSKKIPRNYP